jgi:hypothetical protein
MAVELAAETIANHRGMRRGAPPIANIGELIKATNPSIWAELIDECSAALWTVAISECEVCRQM